jgi:hypothetical protein
MASGTSCAKAGKLMPARAAIVAIVISNRFFIVSIPSTRLLVVKHSNSRGIGDAS